MKGQIANQNTIIAEVKEENFKLKYKVSYHKEQLDKALKKHKVESMEFEDWRKEMGTQVKQYQGMIEDLIKKHNNATLTMNE